MMERLRSLQVSTLNRLFEGDRLNRLMEAEAMKGASAYAMLNPFEDTSKGIFSEIGSGKSIDPYRRNLQRAYVDKLSELLQLKEDKYDQTDIKAMARGTLTKLQKGLKSATKKQNDPTSKYHLEDLTIRIGEALIKSRS